MRILILLFVLAAPFPAAKKEVAPRVESLEIRGQTGAAARDLHQALRYLHTRKRSELRPELLDADVQRLQSILIGKGYLDAKVQPEPVQVQEGRARIILNVEAGSPYRVLLDGRPRSSWARDLCRCLLDERREAERKGVLDFAATINLERPASQVVNLTRSVRTGPAYRIHRLEFTGNRNLKDSTLRSAFQPDEGDLLDSGAVRSSLLRLSESGLIEPMDERSVEFRLDPISGAADVWIRIKEQKRGKWSLSGPIGPMSFAGPLQASVGARLPAWGNGLLNLATYSVSAGVLATAGLPAWGTKTALMAVISLDRPYNPIEGWMSGWSYSPAYSWRLMAQNYLSTQTSQRLMPYVAGRYSLDPPLPVRIQRGGGDAFLICERPAPRLARIRRVLPVAGQLVSAILSF